MENKGFTTVILVVVLIFIGLWFLNSPKGGAILRNTEATLNSSLDSRAAVYPAYPSSSKTLYPVSSRPGYNYYTAPSTGGAYITYPIARSSGSSQYVSRNYYSAPATTTTSSAYYYNTTPDPIVYQYSYPNNPPQNCYMDADNSTVCQYQY